MSELDALRAELTHLRTRVDELERATGPAAASPPSGSGTRVSRRAAFKAAGAAAVAAAAGSLAFAAPAGAVDGVALDIGDETQTGQSPTVLRLDGTFTSTSVFGGLGATNITGALPPDPPFLDLPQAALFAIVDGGTGAEFDAAISGQSRKATAYGGAFQSTGIGAYAYANDDNDGGIGLQAGGGYANLFLMPQSTSTPPDDVELSGIVRYSADALWFSVADTGTGRWRRLTALDSAGAFSAITPVRVYDSRWNPAPGGVTVGTLGGGSREISVADGRSDTGAITTADAVPTGARAIAYNVTITSTTAAGFLNVTPGGTSSASSTINWDGNGITVANAAIVALSPTRTIRVTAGGPGTTQFIIDVAGYWR